MGGNCANVQKSKKAVTSRLRNRKRYKLCIRKLDPIHLIKLYIFRRRIGLIFKQLLDEVEHDIMNYQNRGLCYLPKPKAEADNTDTRFQ